MSHEKAGGADLPPKKRTEQPQITRRAEADASDTKFTSGAFYEKDVRSEQTTPLPRQGLPLERFFPHGEEPGNPTNEAEKSQTSYAAYYKTDRSPGIPEYPGLMGGNTLFYDRDFVVDLKKRQGEYPEHTAVPIGEFAGKIAIPDTFINACDGDPKKIIAVLNPIAIEQLREGKSIVVKQMATEETEPLTFAVYAHSFPEVTETTRKRKRDLYERKRQENTKDPREIIEEEEAGRREFPARQKLPFGTFDQRLLYPELEEYNPNPLSFEQLQELYPLRVQALQEGYVLLNNLKAAMIPNELIPDETVTVPKYSATEAYAGVPKLTWSYDTYQTIQAGYEIRFVESPLSIVDGYLEPQDLEANFSVMFKPKT